MFCFCFFSFPFMRTMQLASPDRLVDDIQPPFTSCKASRDQLGYPYRHPTGSQISFWSSFHWVALEPQALLRSCCTARAYLHLPIRDHHPKHRDCAGTANLRPASRLGGIGRRGQGLRGGHGSGWEPEFLGASAATGPTSPGRKHAAELGRRKTSKVRS